MYNCGNNLSHASSATKILRRWPICVLKIPVIRTSNIREVWSEKLLVLWHQTRGRQRLLLWWKLFACRGRNYWLIVAEVILNMIAPWEITPVSWLGRCPCQCKVTLQFGAWNSTFMTRYSFSRQWKDWATLHFISPHQHRRQRSALDPKHTRETILVTMRVWQ